MKFLAAFAMLFSLNAAAAPQSFDFTLTGLTVAGPHPNEEQAIRKMIAGFIENLHVKRYYLRPTPANGGFRACVQPVDDAYNAIVGELQAIAVRESKWDIKLITVCRP